MTAAVRAAAKLSALNVGCGPVRLEDALGIDRDPLSAADVRHDLDDYPWPFEDGRFEKATLSHVLEHLQDPDRALRETHRVCRGGALVEIVTPHFSSYESYGDITHRFHFGLTTFKPYYAPQRGRPLFELASRRLSFGSSPLCWPGRLLSSFSADLYEKYFAFVCPGRNMSFVLKVLK